MEERWKKADRSGGANNCVELTWSGSVRDSKNPNGPSMKIELVALVAAVKDNRFTR
jgi:Domain of unknown function (DUF397)